MPGAVACLGCGQPMEAPVEAPASLVPRVKSTNPLGAAPPRPRAPPRDPYARLRENIEGLPLEALGVALRGLAAGVVPGWQAGRRGDGRGAALRVAAVVVPLALAPLAWRTDLLPGLGWCAALGWAWSLGEGAHRALGPTRGLAASFAAAALAAACIFGLYAVARAALDLWRPPVIVVGDFPDFPRGVVRVRPLDGLPGPGALIAARPANAPLLVTPVLAGPGQTVGVRRQGDGVHFVVDGAPSDVVPLRPLYGDIVTPRTHEVPAGRVMLYEWPVRIVGPDDILGEVVWRWTPAELRGPVTWPPPAGHTGDEAE